MRHHFLILLLLAAPLTAFANSAPSPIVAAGHHDDMPWIESGSITQPRLDVAAAAIASMPVTAMPISSDEVVERHPCNQSDAHRQANAVCRTDNGGDQFCDADPYGRVCAYYTRQYNYTTVETVCETCIDGNGGGTSGGYNGNGVDCASSGWCPPQCFSCGIEILY